jgi:hypothetical protein
MKSNTVPAAVAVALLLVGMPTLALSSSAESPPGQTFVATLSASPGVRTSATGEASFQLSQDGQSINYTLTVFNIMNVFMAHIHLSPSADILIWLYPNPNAAASGEAAACMAVMSGGPVASCPRFVSGPFSGILAQGTLTAADLNGSKTCPGCSGLSPRTMPALIADMESGQTYVLAHTEQNVAGEIQGSISAVASHPLTVNPATAVTSTTFGVPTTEFYAAAGLAVVLLAAAGFFAARLKRTAS